jgi:hypothetical protein
MDRFDQFAKHALKAKYYIRYSDDFVFLSSDRLRLEGWLVSIQAYLRQDLGLFLHPKKISIKTCSSGIDFLGWISFPKHRVMRPSTVRRMIKRSRLNPDPKSLLSYLGLMKHGNAHGLSEKMRNDDWMLNGQSS